MTDSHVHLQQFSVAGRDTDSVVSDVLKRAVDVGVETYICCGTSPNDWEAVFQLAIRYPDRVVPSFGLHPWAAATAPLYWEKQLEYVLRAAISRFGRKVGIGEIGLDKNCRRRIPSAVQESILTIQLEMARQFHLPVTLHCVGAVVQLTRILHHWVSTSQNIHKRMFFYPPTNAGDSPSENPSPLPPLILHGVIHPPPLSFWPFSTVSTPRLFYSISPAVLDTNNTALRRWVAELPVHQLLVESDSPNRPKYGTAEPAIVAMVLREVAKLRHVSVESLERDCQKNVDELFRPLYTPPRQQTDVLAPSVSAGSGR